MTLPANPELVKALQTIGQGLLDLAAVIGDARDAADKPKPRPAGRSPKSPQNPPAEEPSEDDNQGDTDSEIKFSDLQEMARDLIKAGKREEVRKIVEGMDLETISSAPPDRWPELKEKLEAVE